MTFYKKLIMSFLACLFISISLESRPLHILFVVEYFPAPTQTFILNLMTGLIDKGHIVSIFAFKKKDFPVQHPHVEQYSLSKLVTYAPWPKTLPDCDIVFCQSATLGKEILETRTLSKWLKQRKLVISLRGADITKNEVQDNPGIYQQLFNESDLFLPVCDYFKEVAVRLGCPENKIIVHHSAIDCSKFSFKERKLKKDRVIHLVSVCRLVEKKGLDIALQALTKVIKKYQNIHFTIIGQGPLQAQLEKMVETLGISDKVTFFGWATPDQIRDVLHTSHIFLLPSMRAENGDEEGIANALKEAMATGLISIATYHAGTPELITDNVSGFLVPQKDNTALARKIKYVIKHPELWKAVGLAARKKIEQEFETKQSIKDLEIIFNRLLM